jgi:hypothetical protein
MRSLAQIHKDIEDLDRLISTANADAIKNKKKIEVLIYQLSQELKQYTDKLPKAERKPRKK